MPNLFKQCSTAALLACCLPLLSVAQDEARWYQVELLIFSHEGDESSEQWEATPVLTYPNASRFLVFPGANEARLDVARREAEAKLATEAELKTDTGTETVVEVETEVDEYGRQFIRILLEEVEEEESAAPDIPPLGEPAPGEPLPLEELAPPIAAGPEEIEPLLPTPFIALPRANREFHGKAAYMQRTGYYQTLFHETWVQPVRGEQLALPLVIDRSGDNQQWPRLQGNIKLHLSRYLHIETNLWLNTHGDYLPGEWRMPAPPFGPLSVIIEEPEPAPEAESEPEETPYYVNQEAPEDVSEELMADEEKLEPVGPVYPWRHAVLLNQKRKMRSNEVHYIDHPLLGVVVKLTPLDEEQLQMMGKAELEASTEQPGQNN